MEQVDLQGNVWDCSIGNIEPPISSYESISYDELAKVMERFKKIPNFDELIKDNNKKDKEISHLNNIIEQKNTEITILNNKLNMIKENVEYLLERKDKQQVIDIIEKYTGFWGKSDNNE